MRPPIGADIRPYDFISSVDPEIRDVVPAISIGLPHLDGFLSMPIFFILANGDSQETDERTG